MVLLAGGCGVGDQQNSQVVDDDAVPFGLLAPEDRGPDAAQHASQTELVSLCYVDGDALTTVPEEIETPVRLTDVIDALAVPPPDADSVRTAVGDPPIVADVELRAGIARVDLRTDVSTLAGDDQLLGIAQIVCTLTGRPGIGLVSFTLEGSPVDVPTGDGSLTAEPLSRDDFAALLG
jgi:spore germination protein GerM